MRHLPYRIGKRVGVIRFRVETNEDFLDAGRIVARRIRRTDYSHNDIRYETVYAVRFGDGRIEQFTEDLLWSKVERTKR